MNEPRQLAKFSNDTVSKGPRARVCKVFPSIGNTLDVFAKGYATRERLEVRYRAEIPSPTRFLPRYRYLSPVIIGHRYLSMNLDKFGSIRASLVARANRRETIIGRAVFFSLSFFPPFLFFEPSC